MPAMVSLSPRRVNDYAAMVGEERIAELRRLADPLRGLRVLGVSRSAFGSWMTDLLSCSIPLLQDLGIDASWQIVHTDRTTEAAVVAMYEALSGNAAAWTAESKRDWLRYLAAGRSELREEHDLVIVHDPQLVGLAPDDTTAAGGSTTRWLWNCHTDLSHAGGGVWADLRPFADRFHTVIFEDAAFRPPGWQPRNAQEIPPGIDPLGPRNVPMQAETAALLVGGMGIDPYRPLIAQISPFDVGSDALGLIEVYDALLPRFPDLQLAIIPTSLRDNDVTREYFNQVAHLAGSRPGCVLLPLAAEIGNAEINAFRQVATVIVQKSLHRGFALWLSEAMWQRRPVVAGRSAGTTAQVVDGVTGYVVSTTAACVEKVAALLGDRGLREQLGANGKRHVAGRLLVTRYIEELLQVVTVAVGSGVLS